MIFILSLLGQLLVVVSKSTEGEELVDELLARIIVWQHHPVPIQLVLESDAEFVFGSGTHRFKVVKLYSGSE